MGNVFRLIMPPLLTTYIEETKSLVESIQRRQKDLSEFQIPRLRNCKGPLTAQQNLASEFREDIDILDRQIEALNLLVGDQKGERNRRELKKVVDEFVETLTSLRKEGRVALLASKRAIDSQSHSQREELLRSSALKEKQGSDEKVGDALMKASDDVVEALRRTTGLMQSELERSVLTTQMLDSSTATLRSTSTTHDTLTSVMGTSKQLITALEKSDWMDRLLIITALVFFSLVVLIILKQRIVDRGVRVALWWTRFLPTGDINFDRMERGEGVIGAASVVASSIVTASASSLVEFSTLYSHEAGPSMADDATLSPSLSSAITTADAPWTTDPIDNSFSVRDEL